jgi:UDP-galactopyranose mutase
MADKGLIAVAGAGLSGAVVARELADRGYDVDLFEQRGHVAGNCHTTRDEQTGIMVHRHGPHIFHTDDEEVWAYVQQHATFVPYIHRVKAITNREVFSLPINLQTINQFFRNTWSPEAAQRFVQSRAGAEGELPTNFEECGVRLLGKELYHAFIYGYTCKQWGLSTTELPAALLQRLPVRFTYDDNYFSHRYQGIPMEGYTSLIERIVDHRRIHTRLDTAFDANHSGKYRHTFYTGTMDSFFDYKYGGLGYRTLDFAEIRAKGDYQGCAVMNYCESSVPYTRIVE